MELDTEASLSAVSEETLKALHVQEVPTPT